MEWYTPRACSLIEYFVLQLYNALCSTNVKVSVLLRLWRTWVISFKIIYLTGLLEYCEFRSPIYIFERILIDWFVSFSDVLASGLVEVISPPASYYPDLDRVPRTLGDAPARVRWRTKQNLDLAFLMAYAQPRGTFYVQLEDDILAKKDYVATMRQFALDRIVSHKPWFLIEFCQLGFIG